MWTDEDAQKAGDYVRDHASAAATARAERLYVEEYRKTLKAELMKEHAAESIGAQEREAYSDPRYKEHLIAIRDAVRRDEYERYMIEAAKIKVSAWQSLNRATRGNI